MLPDAIANANICANRHTDANACANANADGYILPAANANACANGYILPTANACANANRYTDADGYILPAANGNANARATRHTNRANIYTNIDTIVPSRRPFKQGRERYFRQHPVWNGLLEGYRSQQRT